MTSNRQERRRAQALAKKSAVRDSKRLAEINARGYSPTHDPEFRKGVAEIVRHIDIDGSNGAGGLCLYRALVAFAAIESCDLGPTLHIGSLLCRVGPDPVRDVVAFCGPGNAGFEDAAGYKGYHAWVELDDMIADFSVGDWRALDPVATERAAGLPSAGPMQWSISLPPYWWRPRRTLVGPWRAVGTPALGQAWYGPYNGDATSMGGAVQEVAADIGLQIARSIETLKAHFGRRHGLHHQPREARFPTLAMMIETTALPTAPPPGYSAMMLSEVVALAGGSLGDAPDAVSYVKDRPTTPEQALDLLRNMTITAGR